MYPHQIRELATQLEKQERAIDSVRFCLDVFLEFYRDGREPTEHMNVDKATEQLANACGRLLGYVDTHSLFD